MPASLEPPPLRFRRNPAARRFCASFLAAFVPLAAPASAADDHPARRPNLLPVVADDIGNSDLGCFGGEIRGEADWPGRELSGNRAIRQGDREPFDPENKPAELNDLSARHPEMR